MHAEPLVQLEQLTVTLGKQTALNAVTVCFNRGEHCVLWGENGAGKSTLLRVLRGEQQADQPKGTQSGGIVRWYPGGIPSTAPLDGRAMSSLVSTAQQENIMRQMWHITVRELVLASMADTNMLYSAPPEHAFALMEEYARQLHCSHLLKKEIPTLSQGQLRLVLTLRAVARQPQLLLLDELVDGLDTPTRRILLDFLEAQAEQRTLILSSHRPLYIPPCIKRALFLEQGHIIRDEAYSSISTRSSGNAWPEPEEQDIRIEDLSQSVPTDAFPSPKEDLSPLIKLNNATVFVERTEVLHALNWTLEQGQHWRIHGANGAGKSTFLRLLHGDEVPAFGGSIQHFLPRHGGMAHGLEDLRRGIGFLSSQFQAHYASTYSFDMDCVDLVCSGFDGAQGIYREYMLEEQFKAQKILKALHMEHLAHRPMDSLSTGQRRRVFIARALVAEPDILLLDEPFDGLDTASRDLFTALLEEYALQSSLVLVTHHPEDPLFCIQNHAELRAGSLYMGDAVPSTSVVTAF